MILNGREQATFRRLMIAACMRTGLTQQQAGRRLKRSQSLLQKYERGERRIDVVEFLAITHRFVASPREREAKA